MRLIDRRVSAEFTWLDIIVAHPIRSGRVLELATEAGPKEKVGSALKALLQVF